MDTASVPCTKHQPADSHPYFVTLDIASPSSLFGSSCGGIDLRWVRSVPAGGIFSVFLLAAYLTAFPSTTIFHHPYPSSATQRPSLASPPPFAYLVFRSGAGGGVTCVTLTLATECGTDHGSSCQVREGDGGDCRSGAVDERDREAGAAHRVHTLHRFCLDGVVTAVR
uniref:Uncharacterized protein n=1 Tax=Aegilops tauschii TaxID=37682 RepID=M8BTJ0_AEGTA